MAQQYARLNLKLPQDLVDKLTMLSAKKSMSRTALINYYLGDRVTKELLQLQQTEMLLNNPELILNTLKQMTPEQLEVIKANTTL